MIMHNQIISSTSKTNYTHYSSVENLYRNRNIRNHTMNERESYTRIYTN